jgi:hypothetical protein
LWGLFRRYYKNVEHTRSNWYAATAKASTDPEHLIAGGQMIADMTAIRHRSKCDRVELNCYGDKALDKLLKYPWM